MTRAARSSANLAAPSLSKPRRRSSRPLHLEPPHHLRDPALAVPVEERLQPARRRGRLIGERGE
ncbi:MAG: hypothetical protein ACXVZL_03800 [Gaiellaceae bacterium]